jgi:predicted nuclease of restriction endonuclease-like (RecB) superfamily
MTKLTTSRREEQLYKRVVAILEEARGQVVRTVNTAMVHAYWLIGRAIVEVEQHGQERAEYGERLVDRLAARLIKRFGTGFGVATLRRVRNFYLTFPNGSAIPDELGERRKRSTLLIKSAASKIRSTVLIKSRKRAGALFPPLLGWSHYLALMRIEKPNARAFYEIEAAREGWSVRELERQIASLLFERLAKSRNKAQLLTLARKGQQLAAPADIIKDPLVLEFLDLREKPVWQERDLEQAIINRIEEFLLELGKGFCFVARQKRITLDGDHYYVDLVLYNRLLCCFVLVDLKLSKLTHQDLGQMQMYVNWFDRFERAEHEARTIGIVLCSEKNEAMVKISLPEDNQHIHAARYQLYMPTEDELRAEVTRERVQTERQIVLASDAALPVKNGGPGEKPSAPNVNAGTTRKR